MNNSELTLIAVIISVTVIGMISSILLIALIAFLSHVETNRKIRLIQEASKTASDFLTNEEIISAITQLIK